MRKDKIQEIEEDLNREFLDYIEVEKLEGDEISRKEAIFIKKHMRRVTI